jgi:hypothetical protein
LWVHLLLLGGRMQQHFAELVVSQFGGNEVAQFLEKLREGLERENSTIDFCANVTELFLDNRYRVRFQTTNNQATQQLLISVTTRIL